MNNRPTLFTRIRNIIVGTIMPKYLEDLWLDVSNGEKKAVLKYKGNPLIGGSGGGSGSDYQSSGSIVKDMVEQGPNFNWAKYAIDIPSLPCFKPEAEWPAFGGRDISITRVLADGYQVIGSFIVKVTGEDPSVTSGTIPTFTDCEPVLLDVSAMSFLTPVRVISGTSSAVYGIVEDFYNPTGLGHYWGPTVLRRSVGDPVIAIAYVSDNVS